MTLLLRTKTTGIPPRPVMKRSPPPTQVMGMIMLTTACMGIPVMPVLNRELQSVHKQNKKKRK